MAFIPRRFGRDFDHNFIFARFCAVPPFIAAPANRAAFGEFSPDLSPCRDNPVDNFLFAAFATHDFRSHSPTFLRASRKLAHLLEIGP